MKTWRSTVYLAYGILAVLGTLLLGCSSGDLARIFGGGGGSGAPTKQIVVADTNNNRVLLYGIPGTTNANAVTVLGQPDFTTKTGTATATGLWAPNDAAEDASGNLWVVEINNGRVVGYKPPFSNGMSATWVLGHSDFTTTGGGGLTQTGLQNPGGVAVDGSGNIWVSDSAHNRVLEFKAPVTNGEAASVVIGEPDFTTKSCAVTATNLCGPFEGIAFDPSGNLWVSDTSSWRILEFKPPFTNGMAASVVIGSSSMTSASQGTTSTQLGGTWGLTFDSSGNLWAADSFNNRVLEFKAPFSNGMAASLVLGQPDFVSSGAGTNASGMSLPADVAVDSSGNVYVADTENSRVLVFSPPFTNGMSATVALGQPNLTSGTINQGGSAAANTNDLAEGVSTVK